MVCVLGNERSPLPTLSRSLHCWMAEALSAAPEDTFVLGGGSVYAQAVDACDTAYVTRIHTAFPGVDCWFPDLDKDPAWQIVETDGPYVWGEVAYSYLTYRRVAPTA